MKTACISHGPDSSHVNSDSVARDRCVTAPFDVGKADCATVADFVRRRRPVFLRASGRRAGRDRHHHRRGQRRLSRRLARRHDHRHISRAAGRSSDERHECARGISVQHARALRSTAVSGEGVLLTVMKRWPWLHTALTVAACLTPAAAQGQDTAAPGEGRTGVLTLYSVSQDAPAGAFPEPAPYYTLRERTYRKVLGDALGDQLDYYSELLDRYHFPGPSYESDIEDYLVRKYAEPDDQGADREWPGRGRSCGAGTGAARVSAANRVRRPRRAAASSTIDRPFVSVGNERVARFGAAGASRHASCVRRERRIIAGCTERSQVSL